MKIRIAAIIAVIAAFFSVGVGIANADTTHFYAGDCFANGYQHRVDHSFIIHTDGSYDAYHSDYYNQASASVLDRMVEDGNVVQALSLQSFVGSQSWGFPQLQNQHYLDDPYFKTVFTQSDGHSCTVWIDALGNVSSQNG